MGFEVLFTQCFLTGITAGCVYTLVGLGFVIIHNVTGVLNFTQGEFYMLGGMVSVALIATGVPAPAAFLIAIAVTTIVAIVQERLTIKPVRQASYITVVQITLAVSIVLRTVALLIWDWQPRTMPPFTPGVVSILGAPIVSQKFWVMALTVLMVIGLFYFFDRTLLGKALRACFFDQAAARLMGISPDKMSRFAFALSAIGAAVAGILMTPITSTSWDAGLFVLMKGMIATVAGHFKPEGVVMAGLAVGILEGLAAGFVSSGYKDAIALFVMSAFIVVFSRKFLTAAEF